MVCSVLLTACSGNGAYVNSVSLEPTFEPSVHPLAVRPLRRGAGRRRRRGEENDEGEERRQAVRNGEWARGRRRGGDGWFSGMSSVLCWVGWVGDEGLLHSARTISP